MKLKTVHKLCGTKTMSLLWAMRVMWITHFGTYESLAWQLSKEQCIIEHVWWKATSPRPSNEIGAGNTCPTQTMVTGTRNSTGVMLRVLDYICFCPGSVSFDHDFIGQGQPLPMDEASTLFLKAGDNEHSNVSKWKWVRKSFLLKTGDGWLKPLFCHSAKLPRPVSRNTKLVKAYIYIVTRFFAMYSPDNMSCNSPSCFFWRIYQFSREL